MEPVVVDRESLERYLGEHWGMPSDTWWEDANSRFKLLRRFFEGGDRNCEERDSIDSRPGAERSDSKGTLNSRSADGCSDTNSTVPLTSTTDCTDAQRSGHIDFERDEAPTKTTSPDSARAGASPIVTLLKTGTHLMGLTALNEELSCLAFGTISSSLFADVFWDTVGKIEKSDGVEISVFQASNPVPDLYRLSFCGYKFRILYFHSSDLVRKYPNVFDAPVTFIDKLDIDDGTKKALEAYHESRSFAGIFENKNWRANYYAIRAWGLARLCLHNRRLGAGTLTPLLIVKKMRSSLENDEWKFISYSRIIENILFHVNFQALGLPLKVYQQIPERCEPDVGKMLFKLNSQSLHQRLGCSKYLLISIIWSGASNLRAAKWIERIDQRVKQLAMRQLISLSAFKEKPYLVPNRLVRPHDDQPPGSVYEAYYVFGLPDFKILEDAASKLVFGVENWLRQTMEDDISNGNGFIRTEYKNSTEMERERFCLCTREWPEETIKNPNKASEGEEATNLSQSGSEAKAQRPQVQPPHEHGTYKVPKLRPAVDVLNRLRYDENYNIDEWVVGYLDRHSPTIQEKPAANWEGETTHEEFIPEHRIEYFKQTKAGISEVQWDKRIKRDWIFNSGCEQERA